MTSFQKVKNVSPIPEHVYVSSKHLMLIMKTLTFLGKLSWQWNIFVETFVIRFSYFIQLFERNYFSWVFSRFFQNVCTGLKERKRFVQDKSKPLKKQKKTVRRRRRKKIQQLSLYIISLSSRRRNRVRRPLKLWLFLLLIVKSWMTWRFWSNFII